MLRSLANTAARLYYGNNEFELFKYYFSVGAYPESVQSFDALLQAPDTDPEIILQALAMRHKDGSTNCMFLASKRSNNCNMSTLETAVQYCLKRGISSKRILDLFALHNIYGENIFHRIYLYQYAPAINSFYKLVLHLLIFDPNHDKFKIVYGMLKKRAGCADKPERNSRPVDLIEQSTANSQDYAAFLLKLVPHGLSKAKCLRIMNKDARSHLTQHVHALPPKKLLRIFLTTHFTDTSDLHHYIQHREKLLDYILQLTNNDEKCRYLHDILDGNHILGKLFRMNEKSKEKSANQPSLLLNQARKCLAALTHQTTLNKQISVSASNIGMHPYLSLPAAPSYPSVDAKPSAPPLTPNLTRK